MDETNDQRLERVYGYHATTRADAEAILARGFRLSRNPDDWLGDGVYFWQDGPMRAWDWLREPRQRRRFGEGTEVAVMEAVISLPLDRCLDLFDSRWVEDLRAVYGSILAGFVRRGLDWNEFAARLRQSEDVERPMPHPLDRTVINELCFRYSRKLGSSVAAVRSIFSEGRRIYPESAFRDRDHVQIAVLDTAIIDRRRLIPEPPRLH